MIIFIPFKMFWTKMPTYWECCESSAPAFRLHRRSPVSVSSGRSSSCRGGAVPADGSQRLFQCAASPGWFCWGPDHRRHLYAALGPVSCCRKTAASELRSPPPGSPLPTTQRPLWCRPLLFRQKSFLPSAQPACETALVPNERSLETAGAART